PVISVSNSIHGWVSLTGRPGSGKRGTPGKWLGCVPEKPIRNARLAIGVGEANHWRDGSMATSPDKPKGASDLETESLPWQPSPGPLAADDVAEGPQEAIGEGSHRASGAASHTSASGAAQAAELAATVAPRTTSRTQSLPSPSRRSASPP